jgi:hypothetical protein
VQSASSASAAVARQEADQRFLINGDESGVPRSDSAGASSEELFEATDPAPVNGLTGKWLLTLSLEGRVSQPWIIEITGAERSYAAKVVSSVETTEPEVRGFRQVEGQVHFELAHDNDSWPFDGVIVAGQIRGCFEVRDRLTLAWLERTRLTSMRSVKSGNPVAGWNSFEVAQQTEDPVKVVGQMQDLVEHHEDSPIVFDALRTVLQLSHRAELSQEQLTRVIERYQDLAKTWGSRWCEHSTEVIASDLATADGPANAAADAMALRFAEAARAALPEGALAVRKQAVELAHAVALVRNNRAEEGKKLLDDLIARATDEDELRVRRFYAAQAAERLSDLDGALELLMPLWPHPIATPEIERIWQMKNGSLAGLDDRLDEAYLQRFSPLTVEPYGGRENEDNNQVALAELFTGTSCHPCVAPDVAFEALGRTFKPSELVLLQYHLRLAGPDPLANDDSSARAQYYKVQGIPSFMVNGRDVAHAGGSRQRGPSVYAEYRGEIENQLDRKSDAKLNISATRNHDEVTIDVTLSDVPDPSEKLRLRLAIVEETVRFHGSNGVRLHHAVVRAMPGGAEGIEVTQSNMNHHIIVNIADIRESLSHQLADVEREVSKKTDRPFEFAGKPLELKKLGIVGCLQDDSTRTVLQAAFVEAD